MPESPRYRTVPLDHEFYKLAMPLVAQYPDGELYVGGTAFMVGNCIALTVVHILKEFARRGRQKFPERGEDATQNYRILAYLSSSEDQPGRPMAVLKSWLSPRFDVAILAVGVPPEWLDHHTWKIPRLSLLPPRRGSEIVAFGYTRGILPPPESDDTARIGFESHASRGVVKQIHHLGRDVRTLLFPDYGPV